MQFYATMKQIMLTQKMIYHSNILFYCFDDAKVPRWHNFIACLVFCSGQLTNKPTLKTGSSSAVHLKATPTQGPVTGRQMLGGALVHLVAFYYSQDLQPQLSL